MKLPGKTREGAAIDDDRFFRFSCHANKYPPHTKSVYCRRFNESLRILVLSC